MNTKGIDEMKKLGIVKRKSDGPEKYEYSFKVACVDCGGKVEWCYCAKSLEDVKKVLNSEQKIYCGQCQFKSKHLSHAMLNRVGEILERDQSGIWDEAVHQMWEEFADGYEPPEPHELDDGTQFWDCDCPTGI